MLEITQQFFRLDKIFDIAKNPAKAAWQDFRPGIKIIPIYKDGVTGASAALLWIGQGVTIPQHRHSGYEHILVLQGGFQAEDTRDYYSGDLLVFRPQSIHTVNSKTGGIVLAIWERPVEFNFNPEAKNYE